MQRVLGTDLFAILLLVWLWIAGFLFNYINMAASTDNSTTRERDMVAVDLAQGSSKGLPVSNHNASVTLSVKKSGNNIEYFFEKKPVKLEKLSAKLTEKEVTTVRIRFDENIPYGYYIHILDLCTRAGVKDIVNVYQIKQ